MFGLESKSIFGSPASDTVIAKLHEGKRQEEWKSRRQEATRTRKVLEGCFQDLVMQKLRSRFASTIWEKMNLDSGWHVPTNRLYNDIMEKRAVAFRSGARFWLSDPQGQELSSPELAALEREGNWVNFLKRMHSLVESYRAILVTPSTPVVTRLGQRVLTYQIHTPETFDPIPDSENPEEWIGYALYDKVMHTDSDGRKMERERATLWFADHWEQFVEQREGNWVPVPGGTGPNEYGVVPAVMFRRSMPSGGFWVECIGPQLAELAIEVNANETYFHLLAINQLKTIAGDLPQDAFPSPQYLRPGGALQTKNPVTLLDFTTDIATWARENLDRPRQQAALSAGIDPREMSGNPNLSGEAIRLMGWNRDLIANDVTSYLIADFQQLYVVTWWVLYVELSRPGALPIRGITALPPGGPPSTALGEVYPNGSQYKLHVEPNEISYPEMQDEREKRLRTDLMLGLINRVQEFIRVHPGVSIEEAFAQLMLNADIEALFKNRFRLSKALQQLGIDAAEMAKAKPGSIADDKPREAVIPPAEFEGLPALGAENMASIAPSTVFLSATKEAQKGGVGGGQPPPGKQG